jgi:hypothetical protein
MNSGDPHRRRQRILLIGLALLFFGPLGASYYMFFAPGGWRPSGHVNKGELIQPPRALPAAPLPLLEGGNTDAQVLRGKWTLLFVQRRHRCDAECLRRLYDTRQVRLALDREMNRVQRVFVGGADCCDLAALRAAHPDLIMVRADAGVSPLLQLIPEGAAADAQRVYLIDPLGNLMMFYAPELPAKGILQDLKRLLQLSSVG